MNTIEEITKAMAGYEKSISFYNKKYNFNIDLATEKEQELYVKALKEWDSLKRERDQLKKAA